ncbi:EAL domain-containing protein [Amantichitinum ursilacus]|uniref:Phytochrome-like protein cph2 n=1 Tax=Amantichitinum ursilacus TaxID=857265 RepID=A0A0N0XKS0_9NEIS|nr:EAL domain-containing protein [Amantichitinum ursilacus]KPC52628.1 Phytochrome-like protein cph2 [Amantichitinum ursilacus]
MPELTAPTDSARSVGLFGLLSRINRITLDTHSPDELLLNLCRAFGESGLFRFAWAGLVEPDSEDLRPLTYWGDQDHWLRRFGATSQLARSAREQGSAQFKNDLSMQPDEEYRVLVDGGIFAAAAIPVRESGRISCVLNLLATDAGTFDDSLCNLLREVADNVAFALEHMLGIQQRSAAESRIHYLAYYEAQTGLPNRILLEQRMQQITAGAPGEARYLTLLDIKLRRLDQVIQILGHQAVDGALRTLAQRLEAYRGYDGILAQLGADEFALAFPGFPGSNAVGALIHHVHSVLQQSVQVDGQEVFLNAGIGVAIYPLHESDVRYLLRRARAAAERAAQEGGLRYYSADLEKGLEQRLQLEADLHRALEREEFELFFQPQLNLKTGAIVGVEALLRWRHPEKGLVGPAQFIPMMEECGMMPAVGEWVLRTACAKARGWQDAGLPQVQIAVNMSVQQFRLSGIVNVVKRALQDTGLAPEWLELELTESLILENADRIIQVMHDLKALGVSLSLDDFGTGYSSLAYLQRFPIDRIKIDKSFIRDVAIKTESAALVRAIVAMAHSLGLSTIAEGVENDSQLGYLRKQFCHEMQGFLFSRPLPENELLQLLRDDRKLDLEEDIDAARFTLLVVDDDLDALANLNRTLRRDGWQVLEATRTDTALDLLATRQIGVVICDHNMPELAGTDFLHRVKKLYPDIVRILLTGYSEFASVIAAVNRGDLYKVLGKPWEDEVLREAIRDAFRQYEIMAGSRALVPQRTGNAP